MLIKMKSILVNILLVISVIYSVNCDIDNAVYSCKITDRTDREPNRCESIDAIIVEETVHDPGSKKIWCIVINNDNGQYNNQSLNIKVGGGYGFGVGYSWTLDHESMDAENVNFKLNVGLNKIAIYAYAKKPFPEIISIKLSGKELCNRSASATPPSTIASKPVGSATVDVTTTTTTSNKIIETPSTTEKIISIEDRYRFLYDCADRSSTKKTTSFCPGQSISSDKFMVEKFNVGGEDYWCLSFAAEKTKKQMTVKLSNSFTALSWV